MTPLSNTFWADECVGFNIIGESPLPYFTSGVLSILGLFAIAFKLWNSDNTTRLGVKSISLILPIYTIPVAYVVVVGVTVGFTNILGMYSTSIPIAAAKWAMYRVAADGLAIFLMHNGIGLHALQRSLTIGTAWALLSALLPLVLFSTMSLQAYSWTAIAFQAMVAFLYILLYVAPANWIHRRPAMSQLAVWNAAICLAFMFTHLLLLRGLDTGSCIVETLASICWLIQPFVILQAMRQDSLFWQGLYVPHKAQGNSLNQPLLGMWDIGRTTMDLVLDSLASLERRVVPIIPFGFLELDNSRFFSGGTARVYRGTYGNRQVAIKMLFCLELTPERVVSFCAESTLLNSLQHPNVVECIGVSIMPPAICLVTEFCQFGSLYDFLHTSPYVVSENRAAEARNRERGDGSSGSSSDNLNHLNGQSERLEHDPSLSYRSNYSVSFSQSILHFIASPEGRALSTDRPSQSGASGSGLGMGLGLGLGRLSKDGRTSTSVAINGSTLSASGRVLWEGVEYELLAGPSLPPAQTWLDGQGGIGSAGGHRDDFALKFGNVGTSTANPVFDGSRHARSALSSMDLPLIDEEEEEKGEGEGEGPTQTLAVGSNHAPARVKANSEISDMSDAASSNGGLAEMASTLAAAVQSARTRSRDVTVNPGVGTATYASSNATTVVVTNGQGLGPGSALGYPLSMSGSNRLSLVVPRSCSDVEAGGAGTNSSADDGPNTNSSGSTAAKGHKGSAGSAGEISGFSVRLPVKGKASRRGTVVAGVTSHGPSSIPHTSSNLALTPAKSRMRSMSAVMASPAFGYGLGPLVSQPSDAHSQQPQAHQYYRSPRRDGYDSLNNSSHGHGRSNVAPPALDANSNANINTTLAAGGGRVAPPPLPKASSWTAGYKMSKGNSSQSLHAFLASRSIASLSLQQAEPSWQQVHLPMSLRVRLCRDAAAGVAYLHANGIMHCDIKSLNFLVDSDLVLKLADLGEARRCNDAERLSSKGHGSHGYSRHSLSGRPRFFSGDADSYMDAQDPRMFPQNINWSAPEVMQFTLPGPRSVVSSSSSAGHSISSPFTYDERDEAVGTRSHGSSAGSELSLEIPVDTIDNDDGDSSSSLNTYTRIGPSADVWSLAMVMAEILTGEVPFDSPEYRKMTVDEFHVALQAGARPVFPAWVEAQVPWLTALIRSAWCYKAAERCGSVELVGRIEAHLEML